MKTSNERYLGDTVSKHWQQYLLRRGLIEPLDGEGFVLRRGGVGYDGYKADQARAITYARFHARYFYLWVVLGMAVTACFAIFASTAGWEAYSVIFTLSLFVLLVVMIVCSSFVFRLLSIRQVRGLEQIENREGPFVRWRMMAERRGIEKSQLMAYGLILACFAFLAPQPTGAVKVLVVIIITLLALRVLILSRWKRKATDPKAKV